MARTKKTTQWVGTKSRATEPRISDEESMLPHQCPVQSIKAPRTREPTVKRGALKKPRRRKQETVAIREISMLYIV